MYKLLNAPFSAEITSVLKDGITAIPFDPANRDYVKFKADVNAGSELQDADGVAMSHDAAVAYVKTLP